MFDFGLHSTEWWIFAFVAFTLVIILIEVRKIWILTRSIKELDKES